MAETKRSQTAMRKKLLAMSVMEMRWHYRHCLSYRWADKRGIRGRMGGWLYSSTGKVMAQGWAELHHKYREYIRIDFWGMDCDPHPTLHHVALKAEEIRS